MEEDVRFQAPATTGIDTVRRVKFRLWAKHNDCFKHSIASVRAVDYITRDHAV